MDRRPARYLTVAAAVLLGTPLGAQQISHGSDAVPGRLPRAVEAEPLGELTIRVDGRVDEPAWDAVEPVTEFTQREPVEGGEPSRRTEVRVTYDADNLYIGAILFDDPDSIIAHQKRRDAFLYNDDSFEWILDTFLDGRTGYHFEVNPNGAKSDGLITGSGGPHGGIARSWDGIWEAETFRGEHGWSLEVRIPFQTLNFDPGLDEWGVNFARSIRRHREEVVWRGFRRNQGVTKPIHAGRLRGLDDLSQGIGVEVRPYAVANARRERLETVGGVEYTDDFPSDVGFDVSYNITPSLRAALSVNTDFAEVEVDQRRVNLTRFSLRFPERRDFFLEGSGVFSFAPRSGPEPYFSRSIGIVGGEQVPVSLGARVGGQAGPYELGFIQVNTGDHRVGHFNDDGVLLEAPAEQFTVARVKRRIFEQSTIGAIYTRRATARNSLGEEVEDRHTAGVDLNYATSTFLGDQNFELEAFAVWNSDPDDAGRTFADLSARGFRANFPNDIWTGHLSYREFGDEYRPAVGFVRRNGFRRVEPRIGWRPRTESLPWLRRLEFSLQYRYLEDIDEGTVEEREWRLRLLKLDFESGDEVELDVIRTFEFLDAGFDITDGVRIEDGSYTTWEASLSARTTSSRSVSGRASVNLGDFWNGERLRTEVSLGLRPSAGVSFGTSLERNDVNLPQGDFETHVARIEGAWDVSPSTSIRGNVQFDDVSDGLGLFLLARWIVKPGNDVFVVLQSNWRQLEADPLAGRPREWVTLSQGASVKLNYSYRF